MYSFPNWEPVCCSMSSSNCCFLTCIQISQEASRCSGIPISRRIFQFVVIHRVKGFDIVNKAEVDVFLELSCFILFEVKYVCRMLHWKRNLLLFSCSVMFNSLQPHGLQHTTLLCSSSSLGVCSNSCPLSWWCHPTISSSAIPFSFCLQSFPASGSFPMSRLFASGGQMIGATASASVLPKNIQDWFPLGLTNLISLHPKGLSRD